MYLDPQLSGLFQQKSSTIILCDMLFNNGMYRDVVHLIQRQRDEQLSKDIGTHYFLNCLLFGACYKLVSVPFL